MFTRWEVPDPTTIENRAAVSAAAINHTSINHCHLAPRQPHTSLCGAPACSSQECWVMRDGKGHPGIRLRAMLGRKERCVMWGCASLFTLTRRVVYLGICFRPEEKRDEPPALRASQGEERSRRGGDAWGEFMTAKNLGLLLTCWMIRA